MKNSGSRGAYLAQMNTSEPPSRVLVCPDPQGQVACPSAQENHWKELRRVFLSL